MLNVDFIVIHVTSLAKFSALRQHAVYSGQIEQEKNYLSEY